MTDHMLENNGTGNLDGASAVAGPAMTALTVPLAGTVDAYAELAKIVLNEQPLGAVLARIAELAAQIIPGADDVSETLIERERARSVAFTGKLAVVLDERQYQDGFGPCMDAAVTGQMISIEDTAHSLAYPEFSRQARRSGIRHTLSVGMPTHQDTTGALNVYGAGAAGPFTQAARDIATTFAGYAAIALLNATLYAGALEEVFQMHEALASRAGIEQAKGILMGARRCSSEEAFSLLREESSRSHRKLRDVSKALIENAITHDAANSLGARATATRADS